MTKIYYTLEPEFDDYMHIVSSTWDYEATDWAEKAAENYHDEHGGWEANWPLHIWLWNEDATLISRCFVTLEAVPTFCAWRDEE
jgi:hypothetical protein